MRRSRSAVFKHPAIQSLQTNSDWFTVPFDKELYWPDRSAHTRAGHVDHLDDLRTLTPYITQLADRYASVNDVLDKVEKDYGCVFREEDDMETFVKRRARTKSSLPNDLLEYLESFIYFVELLWYLVRLKYTIQKWRKQERRRKALEYMHLTWIARYCRPLQGSCIVRCACVHPDERPCPNSNSTPGVQLQNASRQEANTEISKDSVTSRATNESPWGQVTMPPPMLICPITLELLEDPVAAADGFTYSGAAIRRWLRSGKNRSPMVMTNERLAHKHLTPNNTIRSMVLEWRETHKPDFL